MTNNQLTEAELTETLDAATSGYPLTANAEANLRRVFAELQERRKADKPPVHPAVASEKLDDETLQELIEFRRTTFEYHSKEGNKVQTIIHGVTLSALRELQERRKVEMDNEPVCFVSERNLATLTKYRAAVKVKAEPVMVRPVALYRHAQPAPVVPEKCPAEIRDLIASHSDELFNDDDAQEIWNACRAAVLQDEPVTTANKLGNSPLIPDGYVMVPMEPTGKQWAAGVQAFDSGMDKVTRIYKAMLAAARQSPGSEPATVPDTWVPVSERLPEEGGRYWCYVEEQNSLGKSHYQWNCSWNGEIWGGRYDVWARHSLDAAASRPAGGER